MTITHSKHEMEKIAIKPGATTKGLDEMAGEVMQQDGTPPSFKGYGGFPGSICTSVNEELVYGIPSNRHVKALDDAWTVVTEDGYNWAHYEHTTVITQTGYEILIEH